MNRHLALLLERQPSLAASADDIAQTFTLLAATFRSGGRLLLCGNGGSAADCEHWAGELLKGFLSRRPLPTSERERLGADLGENLQGGLPVIPLTGFAGFQTAWLNDCNPDYLYAQLVYALGRPGDTLVGISTSGNSRNVLLALETASRIGLQTVALTGASGGEAAKLAGQSIRVPADQVHHIQELHLPVYHTLCLMLEEEFYPGSH